MSTRGAGIVLGVALLALPTAAAADPTPPTISYDWKVDGTVTAVGGLAWILSETVLKSELAPSSCRWCDHSLNPLDSGVRGALRWSETGAADTASSVIGFVVVPVSALGLTALAAYHDHRGSSWPGDALVILEATVIAADLNQVVKFSLGRERPFVHALPAAEKGQTANPTDNNLSFYSGHTSLVFSLAVSAGTVASMRDYRWAPVVWTVGLVAATTTGYLRIAADKHYFTDVVTGAAVGSLVGLLVPTFLHRPPRADAPPSTVTASFRDGALLAWSTTW